MTSSRIDNNPSAPEVLAFYLPQFHPIPENDEWWGPGFTEWRNVIRGKPLYPDHYQPHVPGELGFYDLRLPEIREAQAALAEAHGVTGFCYYHYWFNGRRILERPFNEVLASGSPDFPFALCWANEPWTRNWDGGNRETLIAQRHSLDDDRQHIRWLIQAFRDERYIRVGDRPVFFVYNSGALDDPATTAEIWREECDKADVGDPFLVQFDTFGNSGNPALQGFDAAAEFLPHGVSTTLRSRGVTPVRDTQGLSNVIFRYEDLVEGQLSRSLPAWTRYQCVLPSWDNTPRKPQGSAHLFLGSTPELYEAWLREALAKASEARHEFVLVNAWNEWAEGTHLEPDLRHGRGYLEATARAVGVDPERFDLVGVHRGRRARRRDEDLEIDVHDLYEMHKSSSARETEMLLRQIQDLEDEIRQNRAVIARNGDTVGRRRRREHRALRRLAERVDHIPVAGRTARTLSILRRDWRSL
jgi:hypothetical protein